MPLRSPAPPPAADPRFRRLLVNAVVVPMALMVGVAVLLVMQIARLLHDSGMVARSDLVLSQAYEVQKLTIDLETGVRGFLVTGQDRFLEPYEVARATIGPATDELYASARGQDQQQARVRAIAARQAAWMAYGAGLVQLRRAHGDYAGAVNAEGKRQMDGLRGAFDELIGAETVLRDERVAHARTASIATFILVGAIAVAGGAALVVAARYQFAEITRTYDAAVAEARDATARLERRVAERTAELNDANGRLGEMNKELEAFAYSISHDLRAPMRHIAGFANLLKMSLGPTLSADDAENLATIGETAKLAGRMVDDLLGFSRVGRVTLAMSAVDVVEVVEACRRALEPDTAGRDVRWIIHPIPPVQADPALLTMAVRNLLANAVKYTGQRPSASINVGPAPWPAAAGPAVGCGPGAVTFAVTDNGVGFDMAYAAKLFGVFQRLHRAEDFDGTGIGLANVKRIIARLGGSVWAEGVPDGGATFYVCLPAAEGPVRR